MNANEIIRAANVGRIATADIDLPMVLARDVIQAYMLDIGDVRWRQKPRTLSVTAGDRDYDLPDDFFYMVGVFRPVSGAPANYAPQELKYIGEDPLAVAAAEGTTEQGTPSGYYFTDNSSGTRQSGAIKFDAIPSQSMSIPYIYLSYPVFRSNSDDVNLDRWIPAPLQAGLIYGLKRVIFMERYGRGDQRYVIADSQYKEWVDRAKEWRDAARRNYVSRVV